MHLPACFATIILTFIPVFLQQRTWRHAELLLIGAILAPGKRTVTSLLRIAGLSRERRFTNYHRVLNRVAWDPRSRSAHLPAPGEQQVRVDSVPPRHQRHRSPRCSATTKTRVPI